MNPIPIYGVEEFTSSSNEKAFYASKLPEHLQNHQFINHHHKHSTFVTVLFTQGHGEHVIDFKSYPVKAGSLFFLNPGQVHCWTLSPDTDGFVFFHSREYYDAFFQKFTIDTFPFFSPAEYEPLVETSSDLQARLTGLFQQMVAEYGADKPFKDIALLSLVTALYVEVSRVCQPSKGKEENHYHQKVKRLQKLIDEHYKEKKLPSEYAELMYMTPRHLNRITQEVLHVSPTDLIQDRIILEAKRLLIHEDSTVTMVADALGYDELSYFIRLFRKKTSITPKEFQLQLKR